MFVHRKKAGQKRKETHEVCEKTLAIIRNMPYTSQKEYFE